MLSLAVLLSHLPCNLATRSTEMIGPKEAQDRMPKPSATWFASAMAPPSASTMGTVTGPVVTPALSQATQVMASSDTTVNAKAMV